MLDHLTPLALFVAVRNWVVERQADGRGDRGDVPGWVLITLMTAGIVTVLWQFAGPRMLIILQDALKAVAPSGG